MTRFLSNNLITPVSILSYNAEDPFFPISNIAHPFRTKTFRTTNGTSAHYITVDFGQPVSANAFALVGHNLGAGDTCTIRGGNILNTWTSSWPVSIYNGVMTVFFNAISYRYWKLDITKSPFGVSQIGVCYLGTYIEPSQNFKLGWKDKVVDRSTHSRSIGGQIHSDIQGNYRELLIRFDMLSNTDKTQLLGMLQQIGTHTPFIISLDQTDPSLTFYGRISKPGQFLNPVSDRHTVSLTFEEAL